MSSCLTTVAKAAISGLGRIIPLDAKQQRTKVMAAFGLVVCIAMAAPSAFGQAVSTTPTPGGGFAQYFTYSLYDWLTLGLRAEIWRDENNFYVAQFGGNNDFIHIERGDPTAPDPSTFFGGKTTYFEVTWGVTLKPSVPKQLTALLIRPEIRYDRALTDNFSPFDQHTGKDQWTLGLDIILQF